MREIKYRAWIIEELRMTPVNVFELDANRIKCDHEDMDGTYAYYQNRHNKKQEFIPLEFTGLKDKNGKEVYEEDIINHLKYGGKFKILWNKDAAGWAMESLDGVRHMFLSALCEIEVIGNVFENKELLNET